MQEDEIFCPACDGPTEHMTVKSGSENLVRCGECGMVHPLSTKKPRLSSIKVIVNRGETSLPYHINIPSEEELNVGMELLVDEPQMDVVMTEITSIETEKRVEKARAEEVRTVWARAIDDVTVKLSIYSGQRTTPLKMDVAGDETFRVGESRRAMGMSFVITKIKLRGEGFADEAEAKDITRVWGREV